MAEPFANLLTRARAWAANAQAAAWLTPAGAARLAALETAAPDDLFVEKAQRPLVVALFGGTGVGKSSLLNRLAGAPLARVAVERPTSREATLYAHRDVALAAIPADAPISAVRVVRHEQSNRRGVVWLDMPDIDSTERHNRDVALAWLPHVDLLIYVVSPERYRDDAGWRVLRERGGRHAWMFVLNHWDEGAPPQRDDFRRLLIGAGFADPLLLTTSCATGAALPTPDEFVRIEASINHLLTAHSSDQVARAGARARYADLAAALEAALDALGDDERWTQVGGVLATQWAQTRETLLGAAQWPIAAAAARIATREGGALRRVGGWLQTARSVALGADAEGASAAHATEAPAGGAAPADLAFLREMLWDEWPQQKLGDLAQPLELELRRNRISHEPVLRRLSEQTAAAGARVSGEANAAARLALASPGTRVQRLARRCTGFLMGFLPCVALAAVAYQVVMGYHKAATGQAPFLGGEFALHSGMLVLVAWLLPFALDRALRPSLAATAQRALRQSYAAALGSIGERLVQAIADARRECAALRAAGEQVRAAALAAAADEAVPAGPLARLLANSTAESVVSTRE